MPLSEIERALTHWRSHRRYLEDNQLVDPEWLQYIPVQAYRFGPDQGQINPEPQFGKWDIFHLYEFIPQGQRLLLAGITIEELKEFEHREELELAGVDPDDPDDVAMYEAIERMPHEDRERFIEEGLRVLGMTDR